MAKATQAKYIWKGCEPSVARRILHKNSTAMWEAVRKELAELPGFIGCVHHDGWKDPYKHELTGVGISYITADFCQRHLLLGFEYNAKFMHTPIGSVSEKSAACTANLVKTVWKERAGASVPFPPFGLSNNTAAAVAATHDLLAVPLRCVVHLLQRMIGANCFYRNTDDEPGALDPMPVVIAALVKLRDLARAMNKGHTRTEWQRRGLGGKWYKTLHLDSGSDWGSTGRLVRHALDLKDSLAIFSTHLDLPPLPSPTEWKYLANLMQCLDMVHRPCLLLQADNARAAQIFPLSDNLMTELQDYGTSEDHDGLDINVAEVFANEWSRSESHGKID